MRKIFFIAFIFLFSEMAIAQSENINIKELLTLTNQQRLKYGKKPTKKRAGIQPLVWNSVLAEAAMVQAKYLYNKRKLTHTGPGGSSVGTRTKKLKYKWSCVGENIAKGQESMEEVINDWMHSPGHRRNILDISFQEFGAAVLMGKDGQLIWVQVFGTRDD